MNKRDADDLARQMRSEGDAMKPEFSQDLHDATMRRLRRPEMRVAVSPRGGWGGLLAAAAAMVAIVAAAAVWFAAPGNEVIMLHPGIAVVQMNHPEIPTVDATLLMQKTSEPLKQLAADLTFDPLMGMSEDARSFGRFLAGRIPTESLRRPAATPKVEPPV